MKRQQVAVRWVGPGAMLLQNLRQVAERWVLPSAMFLQDFWPEPPHGGGLFRGNELLPSRLDEGRDGWVEKACHRVTQETISIRLSFLCVCHYRETSLGRGQPYRLVFPGLLCTQQCP